MAATSDAFKLLRDVHVDGSMKEKVGLKYVLCFIQNEVKFRSPPRARNPGAVDDADAVKLFADREMAFKL